MEDLFTSTVDGAMGFAKAHAESESKYPEGYDPYCEVAADDNYEDHECNCSDPGCPCGGIKRGGL